MITSVILPTLGWLPSVFVHVSFLLPVMYWAIFANPGFWSAVGGVISTIIGSKAAKDAKKLSSTEKEMQKVMLENVRQQSEFGKMLISLARDPLISSEKWLNAATNGDMNTMMDIAGPELDRISDSARGSLQTMAQLGRGGRVDAEVMSQLPTQVALQQAGTLNAVRGQARDSLLTLSTNLAELGGRFSSGSSSGAGGLLDYGRQRDLQAYRIGSDTSESVYNIFKNIIGNIDWTKMGQKKSTTSSNVFGGSQPSDNEMYGGGWDSEWSK